MFIFMWTWRASVVFKNTYFIFSLVQEFAFLSAVIPFVWVPVSLNPNKAVYSSAIWVSRRINPDTKVSLSTATLKAATWGIVHTHTGCKIKIRNPLNLYSETSLSNFISTSVRGVTVTPNSSDSFFILSFIAWKYFFTLKKIDIFFTRIYFLQGKPGQGFQLKEYRFRSDIK